MSLPPRIPLMGYGLAVLVFIADQASKYAVLYGLGLKDGGAGYSIEVLPVFNLTMVWNRGVSFGALQAVGDVLPLLFVAFSLAVSAGLVWWIRDATRRLHAAACGLIIGGALGNALDRLIYGAVADFLDFSGLYFPWVFNVADAAISVGVVLLLADIILNGEREKTARSEQ